MRLRRLDISGFRAFPTPVSLDLDADVVIVIGENGQGKTSIFDAIHWVLTGNISRLRDGESGIVSVYSPSGEASVQLELTSSHGEVLRISRSSGSGGDRFAVELNGTRHQGQKAQVELLDRLWPSALLAADESKSLEAALSRSVYLQQDLVRQFIETDSSQERFNAVSELIGTGRVTELHVQLENAKKQWTTITNQRREELSTLSHKLSDLRVQFDALTEDTGTSIETVEESWNEWWKSVMELNTDVERPESATSPGASSAVDLAVRLLESRRGSISRRQEAIIALTMEVEAWQDIEPLELEPVDKELEQLRDRIQSMDELVEDARADLINERARLREARELREELRTLAQIALRHLEERCPVCTQEYDDEHTRRHLSELIDAAPMEADAHDIASKLREAELELDNLRDKERITEIRLEDIARQHRERQDASETIDERLGELDIQQKSKTPISEILKSAIENTKRDEDYMRELRDDGEQIASELAKIVGIARSREIGKEIEELEKQFNILEGQVEERDKTGDLAGGILNALRESASSIVQSKLIDMELLLQRIYSRIDPHPTFRTLKLVVTYSHGRGHLVAQVSDPVFGFTSKSPESILSSSQMNALAVSIFISFNLGMPSIPLSVAILDDPFQSLDDINLLGLIDLLRRFAAKRQLVVATHDSRFAALLQRKLRPLSLERRTVTIELEGWGRKGPRVSQSEIPADQKPFKIAA